MEIKILTQKRSELFKRIEVLAEVNAEVVPSKEEARNALSAKIKVPAENIDIMLIKGNFGTKTFKVHANAYDSKEEKDKTMLKSKKTRDAEKKAATEAAKAQAPTQ